MTAYRRIMPEGILAEFFKEHKKEVIEMGVYEYDQELHDQVLLEDGKAIGMKKGWRSDGVRG